MQKGLSYRECLGLGKPNRLYFANLNIAQIQGLGSQYGQTLNNDQAQSLMDEYGGGDPTQLTNYFTQQQTTQNNQNGVTNAANQAQTNFNNLNAQDNQSVTDFLSNYKGDVNNAISTANTNFNLPTLEGAVTGLTNRINDLQNNTSNSGGGAESGTGLGGASSESQVGEEINDRELPQLNAAASNLNTASGLAQNQEQIALAPDQAYESLLANNITAGMNGLSQADQTTLQGYMDQLDQGTALTEAQITAANNLATTAMNNAAQITVAQLGQHYQTLLPGEKLYTVGSSGGTPTAQAIAGTGTNNSATPSNAVLAALGL